jgi:general secretion pathway protein G
MATSGIGATTREVDGGVRQVTFGPSWIGSGVATTGIVAAIAVPNLLNAIQRGRTKRTMADMRSLATAVEAFAVDNNRYPSTDGWVDVTTIGDQLAPMYIRTLPATDGWEHAILYWSDGSNYRLVSRGKDGVLDHQWDGELESTTTTEFNADIVYGNGTFIVYPSLGD